MEKNVNKFDYIKIKVFYKTMNIKRNTNFRWEKIFALQIFGKELVSQVYKYKKDS